MPRRQPTGRRLPLVATILATVVALFGSPPPAAWAASPTLWIGDAQLTEPDSGYAYLAFTIRLKNATGAPVTVRYQTSNVSATAPTDYGPAKGEVSFRGSTVTKKVYVPVFGDTTPEPNETFRVTLSSSTGAGLGDPRGLGKIMNDDPAPLTVTQAGTGNGQVVSAPAGISCAADCSESYPFGTSVALTATPAAGSAFTGWSGACTGTVTCTVTMTQARTVTATFTPTYLLQVAKSGNGTGSVTSNPAGITCGSDCEQRYLHGTNVTLTATPAAGSTFTGWTGACTGTSTCTVTMTQARTVTATFALRTWDLTVTPNGNGSGTVTSQPTGIDCGSDCTEPYDHGTTVTLTAAPDANSIFTGWTGGGCSGNNTCDVLLSDATDVTATFTLKTHQLTVVKSGSGEGLVTSSPFGINCGSDCTETYDHGTTVTLSATPGAASTFAGWTGGGCSGNSTSCTVTISQAAFVTATFDPQLRALSVSKGGTGTGTVTSNPGGINCGVDCTEQYVHGTTVNLTAAPSAGSTFSGWSGGGCSGNSTCTVTMTQATSVTATFTALHQLTVSRTGTGTGTVTSNPGGINCGVDCTEQYVHGTTVTLTAIPAGGSVFASWSNCPIPSGTTCTVTMTQATSVAAVFTMQTHTLTVTKQGAGAVSSSPVGISCGFDCTHDYTHGTMVTLTAGGDPGWLFDSWSGGGCAGNDPCTVSMTQAVNVTATFVPEP